MNHPNHECVIIFDLLVVIAASGVGAQLPSVDNAIWVVHELPQADGGHQKQTQEEDFHSDHFYCELAVISALITTLLISRMPHFSEFCSFDVFNILMILLLLGKWRRRWLGLPLPSGPFRGLRERSAYLANMAVVLLRKSVPGDVSAGGGCTMF